MKKNAKADRGVDPLMNIEEGQKTKLKATGSFISMKDEYSLNSSGPYTAQSHFP